MSLYRRRRSLLETRVPSIPPKLDEPLLSPPDFRAVVAVIDPNNCFFRILSRTAVPIARQILLLLSTIVFFRWAMHIYAIFGSR